LHVLALYTAIEEFEVVNSARLYFQNGDTVGIVRCIVVSILDDIKVENDEHFNFTLANGRRTQFNESSIQIFIIDNDGKLLSLIVIARPQATPHLVQCFNAILGKC
jgi:hypothetical protein